MVIPIGVIEAIARLKDNLTPQLSAIQKKANVAGQRMKAAGDRMKSWGRSASMASALVAAGVGAAAVTFGQFESSMNRVEALTGATGAALGEMTAQAKELGSTTIFSAKQAADGMGFLAAAGFETNEIMRAMPGLLDTAAAGQLGLAEAADIASNVLSGFGLEVEDIGRVGDVLAQTAASANTNISMMGETMTYLAAPAKLAGQSLEDMAAMAGQLGNAGIQASMAGTSLSQVIIGLQKPTASAQAVLQKLGVSVNDVSGNMRPLNDIFLDLRDAGISNTDMLNLFNVRALKAAGTLIDVADETARFSEELRNSEGAAARMAETMNKGLKGSFVTFKSATEGLFIALGEQLAPALTWILEKLTGVARWITTKLVPAFAGLSKPIKAVILVVGGLLTALGPIAVVAGTVLSAVGFLMTGLTALAPVMAVVATAAGVMWTALTGPIGLIVAGIALLGITFWKLRRHIGNALSAIIQIVGQWADRMLDGAEKALGWIPGLDEKIATARRAVAAFTSSLAETVDGWGEKEEAAEDAAQATEDAAAAMSVATAESGALGEALVAPAEKANEMATAMADLKRDLLGLPTAETVAEMELLRSTWASMNEDERTVATERYRAALVRLRDEGVALTAREMLTLSDTTRTVADNFKVAEVSLIRSVKPLEKAKEAVTDLGSPGLWDRLKGGFGGLKQGLKDIGTGVLAALNPATLALNALSGVAQKAVDKIVGWVGGKLKSLGKGIWNKLFGPSEAEKAAAAAADKAARAIEKRMAAFKRASENAQAFKLDFSVDDRSLRSQLEAMATWAGVGLDSVRERWAAYQQAIIDGDQAAMTRLQNTFREWKETALTAVDEVYESAVDEANAAFDAQVEAARTAFAEVAAAAEAAFESAKAAADAAFESAVAQADAVRDALVSAANEAYDLAAGNIRRMDQAVGAAVGVQEQAMKAGVEAYKAALKSGDTAEEALEAQRAAVQRLMRDERQKFIQAAAHEAALAEVRNGNAAEAERLSNEAAHRAAAEWQVSIRAAMEAARIAEGIVGTTFAGIPTEEEIETARQNMRTDALDDVAAIRDAKIAAANAARDEAVAAAQVVRDAEIAAAEGVRDATIAAAESARDAQIAASEAVRDAALEAAETARAAWIDAAAGMVSAVSGIAETISSELASIDTNVEIVVHTVYTEEGNRPFIPSLPSLPDGTGTGPSTGPVIDAHRGTGGIRDWGTSGQPARLHGREGVFTEAAIERMIAAAAGGGKSGGDRDVVVELDGEEVGRLIMPHISGTARGRLY